MSERIWAKAISESDLQTVAGLQGGWWRYVTPEAANGNMIFGMGMLQPGEVAGWHEHAEPEIFFVISGQGEARWREDDIEYSAELLPGVAFYKVGNIPHQMVNKGNTPLTGVYFKVAPL